MGQNGTNYLKTPLLKDKYRIFVVTNDFEIENYLSEIKRAVDI